MSGAVRAGVSQGRICVFQRFLSWTQDSDDRVPVDLLACVCVLARGAIASFVSSSEQMSNDGLAIDFSTVPESSYTEENWPLCAGYLRFGMSEFHQREQEKRPPEGDSINHCIYVPVPRPRKRPDDETLLGPWKPPATMRETLSNLGRLSAEPLGIEATKEIFHSKKGEN